MPSSADENIIRYTESFDDVERTDIYSYVTSEMQDHYDWENQVLLINTSDERQLTCKQLCDVINVTSRDMAAGGVGRRSVVTIWCGNCLEIIVVAMAAWKLGALVAMIGPSLTVDEARRQIVKIRSQFLFVDAVHFPQVSQKMFGSQQTSIKTLFAMNNKKFLSLSATSSAQSAAAINPDTDTALIMFSSGTTGYPKAVQLTHSNLVCYLHLSGPKITQRTLPPTIHYLPLSHFYGFSMLVKALCDVAPVYLMERFNIAEFVKLIDKYRVPVLFLVPPVAVMMIKCPELLQQYDMSCVLAIFSAAAPMAQGVEQQLQRLLPGLLFTKIRQGYGMTETTGAVTRSPLQLGEKDPSGSVGKVLPLCELNVIDEVTRKSLGPYKRGEVVVRSPLNMKGYYDDPKATAEIIDPDGWLYTGDIGYYDEDGFIYIVDRAKELIKCRGNQVAPAELEDLLLTHPDVTDVAVVGLPDELSGELPLAFVVRRPQSTITDQQLQEFVAGQVAPYKQLTGGVRFINEIPKLPSGKILRRQLRDSLRMPNKL